MNKLNRGKITGSIILTAVLALSMPMTVCAETYDIANGSIRVDATTGGQTVTQGSSTNTDATPVITGTSDANTVTINAESGATASVTIQRLSIDLPPGIVAPITTSGAGNVVIELDGSSSLECSHDCAALEKRNAGNLTIKDDAQTPSGSLDATGGVNAAGIGGGVHGDGSNITISGGRVTATGGRGGAGIGGGYDGAGSDITICGNADVTAIGGMAGAGIGGGNGRDGSRITISGEADVRAIGGAVGAGIGGGESGAGSNITISDEADVTVTGGENGAGIGGGLRSSGTSGIVIKNNARVSVEGGGASYGVGAGAAIGEGGNDNNAEGASVPLDTSGLYTTGFVSIYPAGTSADAIDPTVPGGTTTVGTLPDPNTPITPPTTSATPSNPTTGVGTITSSSANSGNSVNDSEPSSIDFVLFLESIDKQIEDNLKKLNDLFASGDVAELNSLRATGIKLDTGDWVSFRKSTYALIEQASKAGIPVTIDFIYLGQRYSTTIPAYARISPVSLCNEEGYCGFLNLIKNYGGVER